MKNKIAGLLTVKSLVTLTLTVVFCVLAIRGDINGDKFLTVFTVVISFYFGTKHEQNNNRMTTGSKE